MYKFSWFVQVFILGFSISSRMLLRSQELFCRVVEKGDYDVCSTVLSQQYLLKKKWIGSWLKFQPNYIVVMRDKPKSQGRSGITQHSLRERLSMAGKRCQSNVIAQTGGVESRYGKVMHDFVCGWKTSWIRVCTTPDKSVVAYCVKLSNRSQRDNYSRVYETFYSVYMHQKFVTGTVCTAFWPVSSPLW